MNIKKPILKISIQFIFAGLSVCRLLAQDTSSKTATTNIVTVDALVADILEHNPERQFYKSEIAAAKGERRTAGAFSNPEISTTLGDKRVTSGSLSSEGLAWSVSVKQTFDWPGRIGLRKAIANHQVKLAELGMDQFQKTLAGRTRTLAFNLFAAQEKAAASKEVADRFRSLREVLVQRDTAGLTPVLETRIIEATELTLQRKATEAAIEQQSALLELNQLRGEAWGNAIAIDNPKLSFPVLPSRDSLLATAGTNNFEIRIRESELEMQGFKLALARNEKYPGISVGPYLSHERAGDRETQFGIGLSLPLPIWSNNGGKVATEEARRLQAETSLIMAHRNLERQVLEKMMAYQSHLEAMSKWRPDSVEQFKDAAALADRHYRMGAVPIATYVELQKQYLEAVEALLSTRHDALEAQQELQRLTGMDLNRTVAKEETK